MEKQKLHDLIDKVIGKEGTLRTPAYWMRRVLNDVVGAVDGNATDITKLEAKINSLEKSLTESLGNINNKLDSIISRVNDIDDSISSLINYLTFVAEEDGLTITFNNRSQGPVEYKIDNGDWITLYRHDKTPSLSAGQRISLRGNLKPSQNNGVGTIVLSAKCSAEGTPMSLLYGNKRAINELPGYAFYRLFYGADNLTHVSKDFLPATSLAKSCYEQMFLGCDNLVNYPELPATTLAEDCYASMLRECTSLTTAPELPATELSEYCYNCMFYNCTSLVNAPKLPATTLANSCYYSMFYNCTSLVTAPALPATTLANSCYGGMFGQCTSLVSAPKLPATELAPQCYADMFHSCESLVNAPELPATKLTTYCYQSMFQDCSKLSYIKAMFTTTPSSTYTRDWVKGVAPTGTFVKNAEATWDVIGVNGVPEGWTVETASA